MILRRYFFDPRVDEPNAVLNRWKQELLAFFKTIGLPEDLLHVVERNQKDLAHYCRRCVDICYSFPFGVAEICGIAYRADTDIKAHRNHTVARQAGVVEKGLGDNAVSAASAVGKGSRERESRTESSSAAGLLPHVVEPSVGLERLLLALLLSAFVKDVIKSKERIFLNLHPAIVSRDFCYYVRVLLSKTGAPFKAAVLPVVSNVEALVRESKRLYNMLTRNGLATIFDSSAASIGRRYRRADELGVPYCVTVDDQTLRDSTVTLRWRNTAGQLRLRTRGVLDFICSRVHLCIMPD